LNQSSHSAVASSTLPRLCHRLRGLINSDQGAGQRDEDVLGFGSAFPADGEALELVEQGEGLLDDVAEFAQALDVRGAFAGDDRQDPLLAQLTPVTAGPPPAAAREPSPAREAAAARSASARRHPRSTAEHSHPPERPNRHIGHARPGHLNKIVLRALMVYRSCHADIHRRRSVPALTE
jgi:hypothetical protein